MLTRFVVRNFKSIKALDVTMRPFMVLVGPNGAGKTNFVRALELFGEILERGTTDPAREEGWGQIIRRAEKPARAGIQLCATVQAARESLEPPFRIHGAGAKAVSDAPPLELEASLTLSGSVDQELVQATQEDLWIRSSKAAFHIRADAKGVLVEPGTDRDLWLVAGRRMKLDQVEDRSPTSVKKQFEELFSETSLAEEKERRFLRILNLQRFYLPWLSHLVRACHTQRIRLDASALRADSSIKDSAGALTLGTTGGGLAAAVARLKGTEGSPAFSRVLLALQSVYPRIEDVSTSRIQQHLTLQFKERGIAQLLGAGSISDGVLHALALLVMLEGRQNRDNGILAVEEPENAIHPWSVRAMIAHAQDRPKRQILVTTHSETVVNAVRDPDSLYVVESTEQSGSTITPARDKEGALSSILRESGQKLGDLWLDGTLGGVPEFNP